MTSTQPLITLDNVSKIYHTDRIETLALRNINLEVDEGEFVSIMGPSGCGKSTMLNLLGLLDQPSEGEVRFGGTNMGDKTDSELAPLRNRELGFVFQTFHLISDLRVIDNVEIPLLYRNMSAKERREMATKALEDVGLGARTQHFPTQLSGGQQQRVTIARAMVGGPRILLADEPTGNLDSHMGEEILGLLKRLNSERGTTIIMVTHNKENADATDRTIRLFDGRVVH
jgi:putative ABC transport system ATP-binding protein